MISADQFKKLFPNCADPKGWVDAMEEVFPKYEINTPKRMASFIAQCGHESGGWRVFSENLNYSAKALDAIFGKYFAKAGRNAAEYERQPEKIANVIYAGRMGNNNPGDGWKFRGRGPIQLTGHDNYSAFSVDMSLPQVLVNPNLVSEDKEIALMSAIWFWNKNKLNQYADVGDIKTMTRRINGGYIGLEDRIKHYNHTLEMFGEEGGSHDVDDSDDDEDFELEGLLRRGSRGEGVKLVQEALGQGADGIFGAGTEKAVKEWQAKNGLTPDGIVGPKTFEAMIG